MAAPVEDITGGEARPLNIRQHRILAPLSALSSLNQSLSIGAGRAKKKKKKKEIWAEDLPASIASTREKKPSAREAPRNPKHPPSEPVRRSLHRPQPLASLMPVRTIIALPAL